MLLDAEFHYNSRLFLCVEKSDLFRLLLFSRVLGLICYCTATPLLLLPFINIVTAPLVGEDENENDRQVRAFLQLLRPFFFELCRHKTNGDTCFLFLLISGFVSATLTIVKCNCT